MSLRSIIPLVFGVSFLPLGLTHAACGVDKGSVRILSHDFTALHAVAKRAVGCASDALEVTAHQTEEHAKLQVPALSAEPAAYSVAIVSNNTMVPLLKEDLVRPLDDLLARYATDIPESQLITIDGEVMAIAFLANTQHLWYRKDLLEKASVEPPETYEEVLLAAAALREQGIMKYPLALNFKAGWDLGAEFVNLFLAYGGELFKPGSALPNINGEAGLKTLQMLKQLSSYMHPEFSTYNTNEVAARWSAGEVALYNGWGSRVGDILDPAGLSSDEVINNSVFSAAPTVDSGTVPAGLLWWVGFTIAKNISDEDADASFQTMIHAISPSILAEHATDGTWLIEGYEPTAEATGVFATVNKQAKPYPMLPYMGLMHSALSDNLSEFLQGKESAEQALSDATLAYITSAKTSGFLD